MTSRTKRAKRETETPDYARMLIRMIRSYARRAGDADYVDLADMLAVRDELDAAIREAVREQAARTSWATVAAGLGITRQAAHATYSGRRMRSISA